MNSECLRGGHNLQSPGAHALLDETTEDRAICASAIETLKLAGDHVVDGTPGNCDVNADLAYGTDTANSNNVDLFVPIHLNKAYDTYVGAIGSEVWINPKNPESVAVGTRIVNALQSLGFKNRGLKDGLNGQHLHDIRESNMTAVLIEVCFVEATEDVALYKKLGAKLIGHTIAEAIKGYPIGDMLVTVPTYATVKVVPVAVIVPATRVNNSIALLQIEINKQGGNLLVDGFFGPKTLAALPILRIGAQGNITKWLQHRLVLSLKLQDGDFGPITLAAIIAFQKAIGLKPDGEVGPLTWTALLR